MKDIDFDELDKAVNSLMTPGSEKASIPKPEQGATTTAIDTPATRNFSTPESSSPVSSSPLTSETKPPLNTMKRSTGRFMDVVHPSSDMRSSSPLKSPSRSIGITPPSRAKPLESVPLQPVDPLDTTEVTEQPIETASQTKAVAGPSFPDLLDVAPAVEAETEATSGDTTTASSAPTESLEEAVTDEELVKATSTSVSDPSETLESLFLPNVKVEKRPLGIASNDGEPTEDEVIEGPSAEVAEDKKKTDTLVTPDPTLAELGEDVLAIESDASTATQEHNEREQKPVKSTLGAVSDDSTSALASSAISSIPRQYSVKPSTEDKHHEALYDTAAQGNTPLAHPVKKKSGWMVVLWIVLLIVVGVGGALALYFLKVF